MQTTNAKQLLDILFEGHQVRYSLVDGQLRFVRNDVGAAIGLEGRVLIRAVKRLDLDELSPDIVCQGNAGPRTVATLTESGVYHLILLSRKPAAKRFRRYLTDEVLPQMVKYGSYIRSRPARSRTTKTRSSSSAGSGVSPILARTRIRVEYYSTRLVVRKARNCVSRPTNIDRFGDIAGDENRAIVDDRVTDFVAV